ncbi:MAG: hypothetical protein LQ339_008015 [Xanthoria mediterranea]|nr:MAG: hypothetical protein LQ339_008015 [Xanthoria mediterranea]
MAESTAGDGYQLRRDFTGSTRLNCQHYLWQQELRFNLHPSIPTPVPGNAIADVATGTGVWLLEVAREHPGVNCLGLDISTAQAPPKQWLPSNVDFTTWSIFEEPPAALRRKFDVVHIRLVCLVTVDGPSSMIGNIAMLLKPNGYLQWEELDLSRSVVVVATTDASIKPVAIPRMDTIMKARSQRSLIPKLGEMLCENGFQSVKRYHFEPRMEVMKFHTKMHVLAWAEAAFNMPEGSQLKKEISQLLAEVQEEANQGICHGAAKVVFVAQRGGQVAG